MFRERLAHGMNGSVKRRTSAEDDVATNRSLLLIGE